MLSSTWSRRFTALAIVSKKYERRPGPRRGVTYCLLINALFVEVTVRKRWRRYQCGKVLKPTGDFRCIAALLLNGAPAVHAGIFSWVSIGSHNT